MDLRNFWNKIVKIYVDVKDKIFRTIHSVANKIHTALMWTENKLVSFENSVIFFFTNAIETVRRMREAVGLFIETYRINKIVKLEKKVAKAKNKIAYL